MTTTKGRPKNGYYTADKQRVPSVTTVLSRFKDSGGLIHWAWDIGRQGKDYREERDNAASAGTLAHAAVEAYIQKQPFTFDSADPLINERAERSFQAFVAWSKQSHLEVAETELPLVSERYQFGGTFDAMFIDGNRAVGDWKTSGAIYPEYLVQIAAYGKLWEENFPEQPITGGYHLLRFDKEYGDFSHRWWAELDTAWEAFLHLRALYELEKELKQRSK